jgi:mevalonate kinase
MTKFPAKLLLFGEYSILLGSSALSTPFNYFSASLEFIAHESGDSLSEALKSNLQLQRMCDHFIANSMVFEKFLDLNSFRRDIQGGLYLASTIPQQYGMGSSGALCAAVYGQYPAEQTEIAENKRRQELVILRNIFIQMESYFHGKSSGFDPLISWLDTSLLLGTGGDLNTVDIPWSMMNDNRISVLLVDSGQRCSTGPLVSNFLAEFAPGGVTGSQGAGLCTTVNSAIEKLVGRDMVAFWDELGRLSHFQLMYLKHLVPGELQRFWAYGLNTGLFALKLCGSGGGGYLLCFTHDHEKTTGYFSDRKIPFIAVSV